VARNPRGKWFRTVKSPATVQDLFKEMQALVDNGFGAELLRLQIGYDEHDELQAEGVRVFTFAGTTKIYLVF